MKRLFRVRYVELGVGRNGGNGKPKSYERWANKGKEAVQKCRKKNVRIISVAEVK